jgi:hypothetical protein
MYCSREGDERPVHCHATDDADAIRFHAIVGTMPSLLTCSSGVFTDRAAPAIDKDEDDDE